jgi:hypothetical protein
LASTPASTKTSLPPCIPLPNEGHEKLSLQRKGT